MAARRGRASPGRTDRPRRRGAGLWAAAAVVVVAAAALALTGRLDFLKGADDNRDESAQAVVHEPQTGAFSAAQEPDQTGTTRPAGADTVPVADGREATTAATPPPPAGAPDATTVPDIPAHAEAVPVAAENPDPAPARPAASAPAAAPDGEHYIHVSSFKTAQHANAVATKFSAGGLPAVVREQTVRDVLWYRVYIGPYGTHDDAVSTANRLREEGTITYYKVIRAGAGEGL